MDFDDNNDKITGIGADEAILDDEVLDLGDEVTEDEDDEDLEDFGEELESTDE